MVAVNDDPDHVRRDEEVLARRIAGLRRVTWEVRRYEGALSILWPETGLRETVGIAIEFPSEPGGEPSAYVTSGVTPEADAHASNGKLCLWLPPKSRWTPNDSDALDKYLDEVEQHCRRMLIREADPEKRWPGPSYGHGVLGWIEFLEENGASRPLALFAFRLALDPRVAGRQRRRRSCPCGSGHRLGHCHIDEARRLAALVEPHLSAESFSQCASFRHELAILERQNPSTTSDLHNHPN
jgi:hypothetical protein